MQRNRKIELVACFLLLSTALRAGTDPEINDFESLIKAGEYESAAHLLKDYTARRSDSWQALYQLGYVDFRLHRIQDSVTALCKSILLKNDFADSHKILAFDLNMLGHPELAKPELERAIEYDPTSAENHYELGRIDYEQGEYAATVTELEQARSLAPNMVRVYHNLGLAYAALDNQKLAVKNFEDGLQLNGKQPHPSAWPLIDYATYRNTQRDFDQARDLLFRAVAIDDSWDRAYEELSKAYRGLGQVSEAIEAMKKAIVLRPNKAESHYALSRLYIQVQDKAGADAELRLYERARDVTPK